MTFVVVDNCIRCKYTDCVEVCPVDCFYEGPNFLVINPDECIDCALCEPECLPRQFCQKMNWQRIKKSLSKSTMSSLVFGQTSQKGRSTPGCQSVDGVPNKIDH